MNLKRLFHALVLSGSALGAAHCGGGTDADSTVNAGSGSTTPDPDAGTKLPDGGTSPGMPGGGAPGW